MNELIELVNDLIADKNELIGVATAFEQELVASASARESSCWSWISRLLRRTPLPG